MTNKLIQLIPFIKEDKQQEILKRLIEVKNQYDLLKTEFNNPHEKKIIDMIVGNKPIFQHLQSIECKKKENGELLLGNKDWLAIIEVLRKSMPQQEPPIEKVSKKNVIDLSIGVSEEQRIIQLLNRIVILLSKLGDTGIVLVDSLLQECENLNKIIEQLKNKKQ